MFSWANDDSVRMALLVVIFDKLARSSRLIDMSSVSVSLFTPYFSLSDNSDSTNRALMCFCVRLTVRTSAIPSMVDSCLMKYMANAVFLTISFLITFIGIMQITESSKAEAALRYFSPAKAALKPKSPLRLISLII